MVNGMILRGGRVVDPVSGRDEIADIGVIDGIIVPPEGLGNAQIVDCRGKVIAPGFIDMHVHLRDPGQTHKEDMASGSRAAAAGGFTTVVAMPNTTPSIDSAEAVSAQRERSRAHAVVRVLHTAALTVGLGGEEITDATLLKAAGAVALTDDGRCIAGNDIMLLAMREARAAGIPVIDHCEDVVTAGKGVIHLGTAAAALGVEGKPRCSEDLAVARNIVLAAETGCRLHVQHVSSHRSVGLVRDARRRGWAVTAEATPHHICLTDEAVLEFGADAKMNPPLREAVDRDAIIKGLVDGTIAAIATDHAPHTAEEKSKGLVAAPFGIIGMECAVPVCLTALYHTGILSMVELISKFTLGPREILNLAQGALTAGDAADITILDAELEMVIDRDRFQSKARNCPFHGRKCRGKAIAVLVAGEWVHVDEGVLPGVMAKAI